MMDTNDTNDTRQPAAISNQTLRSIVDQGFFGRAGSLADARSACAELILARAMIEAQTRKIELLGSALAA